MCWEKRVYMHIYRMKKKKAKGTQTKRLTVVLSKHMKELQLIFYFIFHVFPYFSSCQKNKWLVTELLPILQKSSNVTSGFPWLPSSSSYLQVDWAALFHVPRDCNCQLVWICNSADYLRGSKLSKLWTSSISWFHLFIQITAVLKFFFLMDY